MDEIKRIIMDRDFYLIADTHSGHKRIIDYCSRPFQTTEEMNKKMIDNWNKVIKKDDIVIHLGDVSVDKSDNIKKFLKDLNGVKWLIRGNHDYSNSVTKWKRLGFEEVLTKSKNPHEYVIIEFYGEEYALSHFYLPTDWGLKNIHGHVHNNISGLDSFRQICVSVENINYTPIKMSEVVRKFKRK